MCNFYNQGNVKFILLKKIGISKLRPDANKQECSRNDGTLTVLKFPQLFLDNCSQSKVNIRGPSEIVTEFSGKGNLEEIFWTRNFPLITSHFITPIATFLQNQP